MSSAASQSCSCWLSPVLYRGFKSSEHQFVLKPFDFSAQQPSGSSRPHLTLNMHLLLPSGVLTTRPQVRRRPTPVSPLEAGPLHLAGNINWLKKMESSRETSAHWKRGPRLEPPPTQSSVHLIDAHPLRLLPPHLTSLSRLPREPASRGGLERELTCFAGEQQTVVQTPSGYGAGIQVFPLHGPVPQTLGVGEGPAPLATKHLLP